MAEHQDWTDERVLKTFTPRRRRTEGANPSAGQTAARRNARRAGPNAGGCGGERRNPAPLRPPPTGRDSRSATRMAARAGRDAEAPAVRSRGFEDATALCRVHRQGPGRHQARAVLVPASEGRVGRKEYRFVCPTTGRSSAAVIYGDGQFTLAPPGTPARQSRATYNRPGIAPGQTGFSAPARNGHAYHPKVSGGRPRAQ
jgi:pyruvate/2-oxoglutarate dehydrogenase complex dihydrolipoamide acyltransferase (E2) component